MNEENNTTTAKPNDAEGVAIQRIVRRCSCKYQKEKDWGYHLWEWVGGKKSWQAHGHTSDPQDTLKFAENHNMKKIMVKCMGCGNTII